MSEVLNGRGTTDLLQSPLARDAARSESRTSLTFRSFPLLMSLALIIVNSVSWSIFTNYKDLVQACLLTSHYGMSQNGIRRL